MRQISEEQLQQLISYLSRQPYNEVFKILGMLFNLPLVETKDKRINNNRHHLGGDFFFAQFTSLAGKLLNIRI